jgi:hypothetical protein
MRLVEAEQQVDDRRLPRPGVSDEGHRLTRPRREAHAAQHPRRSIAPLTVVEPYVLERDRDPLVGLKRARVRVRQHLRRRRAGGLRVEQQEDPLRRGHRLLQRVELVGQVLQRLVESPQELEERRHHAHAQRADADAVGTRHEQDGQRERSEELDRRKVERIDRDRTQMRVEMPSVQRLEPASFVLLAAEQLHDAHAGDPLLQRRVDFRQPRADVPIRHPHALLEQVRREIHERDHGERRDRESPVRDDHHHRDRRAA